MNVGKNVEPGDDHSAVALVSWNLKTQKVFRLYRQDGEGSSGCKTVQHWSGQEN